MEDMSWKLGFGKMKTNLNSKRSKTKLIVKSEELTVGISDVGRGDFNMLPDRQCFGKEISKIDRAFNKGHDKLVLSDSITNPVEAHVYALRLFRFDCGLGETDRALTVTKYCGRRLRVAQANEAGAFINAQLGVAEGAGLFLLRPRGTAHRNTGAVAVVGSIYKKGVCSA